MTRKFLSILVLGALLLSGCGIIPDVPAKVIGSGNVTSETRSATGFTSISLQGSADVNVTFGNSESIVVTAEDNIVSLIETNVQNRQLVVKTKPLMTFAATKPVKVNVTMITLQEVSLSGSGNINVPQFSGESFSADLSGSGNITIAGVANTVNLSLGGSGNIYCDGLKARTAKVTLKGSGNITVYASDSLDATLSGSGNIRYSGNPAKVNKSVTGSGNIQE